MPVKRCLVSQFRAAVWFAGLAFFWAVLSGDLRGAAAKDAGGPPNVVVSIAPVHSLAVMVMDGVAKPHLLLPKGASPHGYALRPSDARALAAAHLVLWVGPGLERFLVRPLTALVGQGETLALMEVPGLTLHPPRRAGTWPSEGHEGPGDPQDDHGDHGHQHAEGMDPHIWLDPRNGRVMIQAIGAALKRLDPVNGARYLANAQKAAARIDSLDSAMAQRLAPLRSRPFIVFHDAYRYFEARYGLNAVGSIVVSADRRPGIKRLMAIRDRIRASGAVCVFAEPQFSPRIAATVVEDTGARIGVLDPLGSTLDPGPGFYGELLNNLARDLAGCLGAGPAAR